MGRSKECPFVFVAAPGDGGLEQSPFILISRSFGRRTRENLPFYPFFGENPRSGASIEGSGAISERSVVISEGSGTVSERSVVAPEGSGTVSERSVAAPEGSEMVSERSVAAPEGSGMVSERSIAAPERSFGAFAHDFWSLFGRAIPASCLAGCSST
jgi:hypothetical protein